MSLALSIKLQICTKCNKTLSQSSLWEIKACWGNICTATPYSMHSLRTAHPRSPSSIFYNQPCLHELLRTLRLLRSCGSDLIPAASCQPRDAADLGSRQFLTSEFCTGLARCPPQPPLPSTACPEGYLSKRTASVSI